MKKYIFNLLLFVFVGFSYAQVGIGTTNVDASAMFEISSDNSGFLMPKLTMAQRDAIPSPATSLIIYQTNNTPGFYYFNGTSWVNFEKSPWLQTGNAGTTTGVNSVGTLDNNPIVVSTNNTEALRITPNGNVGVGVTNPNVKLAIQSSFFGSNVLTDGFEDGSITPFTTSGDQNWVTQSTNVQSGSFAARSGTILDNQTSSMFYNVTIPSSQGELSFWSSTSCEFFDQLRIYINGVLVEQFSGANSYAEHIYTLPEGTYDIEWRYVKDFVGSVLNDAVYVDNVTINTSPEPTLLLSDGTEGAGKVLTSNANGEATWTTPTQYPTDDADWAFSAGTTNADHIYHQGPVMIGQSTTTPYNLHVYNGSPTGTTTGFGSVEILTDGNLEVQVNNTTTPILDGGANAGSLINRWTAFYSANGVVNTSDRRLKKGIKPLKYGLNEVLQLEPVSFKWKEENIHHYKIPNHLKETKLGFIAQDVQRVLPEVVKDFQWKKYEENPNELVKYDAGRLGMSYSELIPVVIKSIQEQELLLQEAEAKNKLLKDRIAKLKE